MNVLFVQYGPIGDSGAAAAHYFPTTLAQLGHKVTVVGATGGDATSLISSGVNTYELAPNKRWTVGLGNIAEQLQPQLVHVFIFGRCGLVPLVLRRKIGAKFVLDIRSPLIAPGLSSVRRRMVQVKKYLESRAFDVVTAHSIESARTQIGNRREIRLLPFGVDFEAIKRSRPIRAASSPARLVYVGALSHLRRIDQLLRAVSLVADSMPITLDIFGYGLDRDELMEYASRMRHGNLVRFQDPIPRADLFNALPSYDVGLSYVPHRIYEMAPPLKTLEYLACGLPTAATDTVGNRVFIEHRRNGLLLGEDPQEYADGIVQLLRDQALFASVAEAARPSIANYGWPQVVQQYLLPVYQEALGGSFE